MDGPPANPEAAMQLARSILLAGMLIAAPLSAFAFGTATASAVNLRQGPDRDFAVIMVVPVHTAVRVRGCIRGWRWCNVVVRGQEGWMDSIYFRHNVQGMVRIVDDPRGPGFRGPGG